VIWLLVSLAFIAASPAAFADDLGDGTDGYWETLEETSIEDLLDLNDLPRFEDNAPLWDYRDDALQRSVDGVLADLKLEDAVRTRKLSLALIDLTNHGAPRVASVNGDKMMYAASLPKIAILLAAFEKIAQGKLSLDEATEYRLDGMIKRSSNRFATEMMNKVGKEFIARVLLSPRYRLYDPRHGGGLWVGKDYAKSGLWRRDPLYNLSHGATAMQVARFYYLLATENLVTPEHSRKMQEILSNSELDHKFVRALRRIDPKAEVYRKSGSWSDYHSDSALVQRNGHSYIVVVLSHSADGAKWLERIVTKLDGLVVGSGSLAIEQSLSWNPMR